MNWALAGQYTAVGIIAFVSLMLFYRWAVRGAITQEELDASWEEYLTQSPHYNRLHLVTPDEHEEGMFV